MRLTIAALLGMLLVPFIASAGLIAFDSFGDLYTMNSDGSDVELLVSNARHPAWAPDGNQLAFSSGNGEEMNIFVVDLSGDNIHQVTAERGSYAINPSWSPDGRQIVFSLALDDLLNGKEIHVINIDGTDHRVLTNEGDFNDDPSWSPDGSLITFDSARNGSVHVYLMDEDGANVTQLTQEGENGFTSWSPTGDSIAFMSNRDGNADIYTMDADGRNQTQVTKFDDPVYTAQPSWSPDGDILLFVSTWDQDGGEISNPDVFSIRPNGSGIQQLTRDVDIIAHGPTWQPVSSRPVDVTGKLAIPWAMLKMPQ